jgi:signal transduction histidine kinase
MKMVAAGLQNEESAEIERSRKVRRGLLLAFGGLLALMIAAGLDSLWSLRALADAEHDVNTRFSAHTQALSTVILTVHVYHEQMERYLLDWQNAPAHPDAADVVNSGTEADMAVQKYPADLDPQEQLLLQRIQTTLAEQESSFAPAATWAAAERQRQADQFIREQIMPRRIYILQVSRDVSSLNDRRLVEATQLLAANVEGIQSRLVLMVALSLFAGLLLSLIGGFYILRLEQQGRRRYQLLVASRQELESLSGRLVEAQEEERRSISRELHDEVGQSLGALLVDLGQLSNLVPAEDGVVRGQIARIKSTAETAVKSIRDMALLLRPPMLDDLGLVPALEWLGREVSRRGEMEVDVHSEKVSEQLSDEVKVCVYRLVQEALNNAARHAAAKHANVSLTQSADKLSVEIKDDGHGFAAERVRGMGILGMEERVKRLGGTVEIQSVVNKGTTVHAELPVPRVEHA